MGTQNMKLVLRARITGVSEFRNVYYYQAPDTTALNSTTLRAWASWLLGDSLVDRSNLWQAYAVDVAAYPDMVSGGWTAATTYPFSSVIAGSLASDYLPLQCAIVLIAKTGVKRVIGRKFEGAIGEAGVTGGLISGATLTRWNDMAVRWATNYTNGADSWTPVIWGPAHGFVPIASAYADAVLGTCRRRKPGVGI